MVVLSHDGHVRAVVDAGDFFASLVTTENQPTPAIDARKTSIAATTSATVSV